MNLKRLYQKQFVLPVVIAFTYTSLLLDTIKYPGFIGNHFLIDAKVYFAIAITLLLLSDTKSKLMDFILKTNRFFLPVISLVYLVFSLLEGANYTNYVLATFKFHLAGMVQIFLFSLSIFLVDKFKDIIPKYVKRFNTIYLAMLFLIIFFMVKNLTYVSDMAVKRNSYILFHLGNSYDQKMFYEWGVFYRFMVFVKNNTPPDTTIIIPPMQDPWLMGSGNDHFVRAFLFPRKIVPETLIISDIKKYNPGTYILITWGKEACKPDPECHGWPRQDISAKKVIYKDPDSAKAIEVRENTIYRLEDDKYVYGVIEL